MQMVPYRDSRLTHLFKNYFDGDGKVRMIVCVNPRAEEYDETIHVMKFAEMSQEVLVTRSQQVQFNVGLTPGRRRMHQEFVEKVAVGDVVQLPPLSMPRPTSLSYSLGPPFPLLELLQPNDDKTLSNISMCLDERMKRRQQLLGDFQRRAELFRAQLLEFERNYDRMGGSMSDIENALTQEKTARQRLESRLRNAERKGDEWQRRVKELEKENQTLTLKLQDKNWKIQVEKTEKDRLKQDYQSRLTMNNRQWEKNMDKIKAQLEADAEAQIEEKERKLDLLRELVNNEDTPRRAPRPAPKPRTYTTPATTIIPTRSEPDMSGMGLRTRSTRTTTTPCVPVGRIPAARSMQSLNQVGASGAASAKKVAPVYSSRYHRRSKSSSNAADVWLDHRPRGAVDTNTVLQPKMMKKRSVSKLEVGDTKHVSKYALTHQDVDSNDELVTKIFKGDVIPTTGGGAAVVFHDVEELKQTSPGSRKRRSSCPEAPHVQGDWTDTESRCAVAIECHGKRQKSNV